MQNSDWSVKSLHHSFDRPFLHREHNATVRGAQYIYVNYIHLQFTNSQIVFPLNGFSNVPCRSPNKNVEYISEISEPPLGATPVHLQTEFTDRMDWPGSDPGS